MVLMRRKRVFAAKTEVTIGTPIALANADGAFNVYDLSIQPTIEMEEREAQGAFNYLSSIPGTRMGTVTFKTDLSYDGANIPTWASVLLPACGWVNNNGTFGPRSESPGDNVKTLTIGVWEDGKRKSIAGAMGNFVIQCPAGKTAFIEWTFQGTWQPEVAEAMITPTYPTVKGLKYASATTTYATVAMCVANISFDAGNSVIMRECGANASGFVSALITNRKPVITADPESVLIATQDRYASWLAATEGVLNLVLTAPATETFDILVGAAQINNIQGGDRSDMLTDQITWTANKNSTTNDAEMRFTFSGNVV